jgi:hypothetical protein
VFTFPISESTIPFVFSTPSPSSPYKKVAVCVLIIFIVDTISKYFHVSTDWHDVKSKLSLFQAHSAMQCNIRLEQCLTVQTEYDITYFCLV